MAKIRKGKMEDIYSINKLLNAHLSFGLATEERMRKSIQKKRCICSRS